MPEEQSEKNIAEMHQRAEAKIDAMLDIAVLKIEHADIINGLSEVKKRIYKRACRDFLSLEIKLNIL